VTRFAPPAPRRLLLAAALGLAGFALPVPGLHGIAQAATPARGPAPAVALAIDGQPTPAPAPTGSSEPTPIGSPERSQPPEPSDDPPDGSTPPPDSTPTPPPSATPSPSPSATPSPSPSATPSPSPSATPSPSPTPSPTPMPSVPASLNLFKSAGFRYQDPNYTACTATSAMDMLNFIALSGSGGTSFRWHVSTTGAMRDKVLAYERSHDTIVATAHGSDPHGWRNALNAFGWGSGALRSGQMVYADRSYASFTDAIRAAVRQMILTRKPVGILGWAGKHAQMITGYYGLKGHPLAKNPDGSWSSAFSVAGVYMTDPLRADAIVNRKVSLTTFGSTGDSRLRFRPYRETDSPFDDAFTPGFRVSRTEWYGKFTLLLPLK
jgi:hypothetical protein